MRPLDASRLALAAGGPQPQPLRDVRCGSVPHSPLVGAGSRYPLRVVKPLALLSPDAARLRPLELAVRARREPIVPLLGRAPRVHLWHIGCQMNDADREDLAEQFADIGFIPEVPLRSRAAPAAAAG